MTDVGTTSLGELTVSVQGLGCMGMSDVYGAADWDTSVATIHRALDLGVTFIDTADIYGTGHNEVLVHNGNGADNDEPGGNGGKDPPAQSGSESSPLCTVLLKCG